MNKCYICFEGCGLSYRFIPEQFTKHVPIVVIQNYVCSVYLCVDCKQHYEQTVIHKINKKLSDKYNVPYHPNDKKIFHDAVIKKVKNLVKFQEFWCKNFVKEMKPKYLHYHITDDLRYFNNTEEFAYNIFKRSDKQTIKQKEYFIKDMIHYRYIRNFEYDNKLNVIMVNIDGELYYRKHIVRKYQIMSILK